MNEIREELGDRVYGSALAFGVAVGGMVVLLAVRAVLGF
jgi:hypothetical protein